MKLKLITLLIILFGALVSYAAPIKYLPQTITQPSGETIKCYASGDEYYNWLHDAMGYTIIQNKTDGYYYYAVSSGDTLIASKHKVGSKFPFTLGLSPWTKISNAKIMEKVRYKTQGILPKQKKSSKTDEVQVSNTGTMNNIVIYIRFSDEAEFTDSLAIYDRMLNPTTGNSMKNYFKEVSYNQLTINSTFYPDSATAFVVSYQDTFPRAYYRPYSTTNPTGYNNDTESKDREFALLVRAVDSVKWQIPSNIVLDNDNDGRVDNVVFVVSGSPDGWANLLWPHRWAIYDRTVNINNKRVYDFNLQLRDHMLNGSGVGVLCHEMFHSLGAPDLYRYQNTAISPVGPWDLMEQNANPPQHMGVYMKYKYGDWISQIPAITSNGTYTLNPITSSTNNCYKIASPYSTTEYFLVEYRKKTGTFENSLPASGLLIYRINPAYNGNASGPPDEVYLYRPNGTNSVNGTVNSAHYSSSVGRTSINYTTNPSPFLTNGSQGGLNISQIGVAGETISFHVSFNLITPTLRIPLNNATNTTIRPELSWDSVMNATSYRIQISTNSGFSTNVIDRIIISNTFTPLNDLNYETTYYWRVKAKTASDSSEWSTANSFATIPDGLVVLMEESFEGATFPPSNWTTTIETGTLNWSRTTQGSHPTTCNPVDGVGMARYPSYDASTNHTSTLQIPAIQMKYTNQNTLYLKMYRDDGYTSSADRILIYANTQNNLTNAALLGTVNRVIGMAPAVSSIGWYEYSYVIPEAYLSGNCYIMVKAISGYGNDIYVDNLRVLGVVKNLLAPALSSPTANATNQNTSGTMTWVSNTIADEYDIQISQSNLFTSNIVDVTRTTNSYNYSGLTANEIYYWRVRSRNLYKTSEWSEVRSFSTSPTMPAVVTLISPANDATSQSINLNFTWNAATNSTSYQFQLSTNSSFSSLTANETINGTSKSMTNLANGTTYYWRVHGINSNGNGDWSSVRSFSTIAATPANIVLVSPAANATSVDISTPLTWLSATNASTYRVQLATSNTFTSTIYNQVTANTSFTPSTNLSNGTTYYWRVQGINGTVNGAWSDTRQFATKLATPAVPALVSPVASAIEQTFPINFTWNSSNAATHYSIQISLNPNFSTLVNTESQSTDTTFSFNGNSSTLYYWRVKAYNSDAQSDYSASRSLTTKNYQAVIPALISPTDVAVNQALPVSIQWNSSLNSNGYQLQIATDNSFNNLVSGIPNTINETSYSFAAANSTTYFWRVRSISQYNGSYGIGQYSDWSSVRSFSTIAATPANIVLVSPAVNAASVDINTTLTWQSAANSPNYRVQLSTSNTFASTIYNQVTANTSFTPSTNLSNGTTYYWRVQGINGTVNGAWSEARQFSTKLATPAVPVLVAPVASATEQEFPINFTWNSSNAATHYSIQISLSSDFSTLVNTESQITATSFSFVGNSNTVYYWRVKAYNSDAQSEYSASRSLTTKNYQASIPTLISPADVAVNQALPVSIQWNSSLNSNGYQLQIATDNSFTNLVSGIPSTISESSYSFAAANSTTYFWRVRAINQYNGSYGIGQYSDWSSVRSFSTEEEQEEPVQYTNFNINVLLAGLWNGTVHKEVAITIELRTGSGLLSSVLYKRVPCIISSDGIARISIPNFVSGDYWVIVRATSYLSIASKLRQNIQSGIEFNYDFSRSSLNSYTSASVKLLNGRYLIKNGELNEDKSINGSDGILLDNNLGSGSSVPN